MTTGFQVMELIGWIYYAHDRNFEGLSISIQYPSSPLTHEYC